MAAMSSKKGEKLTKQQEANRAGSVYHSTKKEFSTSYFFEAEVSEWFHINSNEWPNLVIILRSVRNNSELSEVSCFLNKKLKEISYLEGKYYRLY